MKEIKATMPVMPAYDEYIEEIKSIWTTGIMTNNGEKTQAFKNALCQYMKHDKLDLFVNGHSALMLAIKAMALKGEVITSPFTFVSTTNAIVQNGLTPVFADIDDSYNLNPDKLESLITEHTSAIIAPHIFGIPCDVERIKQIADRHNLKVIYDGAQAFGTKIRGKAIGTFGDATMFSFHAIKVFNSIEGGMLAYKDERLQRYLELYRNFGISYNEAGNDVEVIGMNAKMNEFQAAMGIVNLSLLEREIEKRKHIAQLYFQQIKDIEGITTYQYADHIDYNYGYFPIKIFAEYGKSRDEVYECLKKNGIGSRKLYNVLTCDYSCYKDKGYKKETDYADKIKEICLDLPIYGQLTENEVSYICDTLRKLRN